MFEKTRREGARSKGVYPTFPIDPLDDGPDRHAVSSDGLQQLHGARVGRARKAGRNANLSDREPFENVEESIVVICICMREHNSINAKDTSLPRPAQRSGGRRLGRASGRSRRGSSPSLVLNQDRQAVADSKHLGLQRSLTARKPG